METTISLPTAARHLDTSTTGISVGAMVINYNGGERVLRTLQALSEQATPLAGVLVVDNGSNDGSVARIRAAFPHVDLLEMGGNRGLPAARNAGLARVQHDLVLLLDADMYVGHDCVARLLQAWLAHGRPAVVCPRIRLIPERDIVQAEGAGVHFIGTMSLRHGFRPADELDSIPAEVDGCSGGSMLLDRRAVTAAGGFDELYFFYFEDLEFSLRMRAFGHRFVCEPRAVVEHDRGEGTPGLSFRGRGSYPMQRVYLTMRHRLLTILIHYRWRTLIVLAPALALYELASLGLCVRQRYPVQWLRAWAWQLQQVPAIRQRRRVIHEHRVRSDRQLLTGGPLPLAPGVLSGRTMRRAVACLSGLLNVYWRVARHAIA